MSDQTPNTLDSIKSSGTLSSHPSTNNLSPSHPSTGGSRSWIWLLVVAIIVGGGIFFFVRQGKGQAGQAQAFDPSFANQSLPITTTTAAKGDIGVYVNALGTVTPVYTVSVTSRVVGAIMSVNYTEGQIVHKADPLLEIDPRPYQAALTQAEGQLAHDQAVLNEARIDLTRYQAALARNAIPVQQVDDTTQVVQQDEGTVKNDQGIVDNARLNLAYCSITSPIDGRVGLRLVDPGNIVQANGTNPLVVITQLQPITVVFSVAEDYLPQIQEQLRAGHKLQVDALDRDQQKKIAAGTLLTLDNQIDTTTGTIKLKAIFPNTDDSLFPNQFVNARLLVDTQHGDVLIPTAAIQRNAQGAFVYQVKPDQTVAMHTLTTGVTDGNVAAVQGLDAGAVIALDNFDKLQDGMKVVTQQTAGNPSQKGGS
jgi:membrane fusion protein, multidrug efflux system